MTTLEARLRSLSPSNEPRTLAERVYVTLREGIVAGTLAPGERLMIEELAAALGTSPMPVRDALRRLDADGLVENIPHRGSRVREISLADLEDVYTARIALETAAIRRSAGHFTDEAGALAQHWLVAMAEATNRNDMQAALKAHEEFHFALYRTPNSEWVMRLIKLAWEGSQCYRTGSLAVTKESFESRSDEHRRILHACLRGDPDAAEAELKSHLAKTANQVSQQLSGHNLFEFEDAIQIGAGDA